MRVGLPRGFFEHLHGWVSSFLRGLGFEPVTSDPTSRRTLEEGFKLAFSDTCLPVKIYAGHVREALERADLVLIPRLENDLPMWGCYCCPKSKGMADVARALFGSEEVRIVSPRGNLGEKRGDELFLRELAKALGVEGSLPPLSPLRVDLRRRRSRREGPFSARVGLVGYPYILMDEQLGGVVFSRLESAGAEVVSFLDLFDLSSAPRAPEEVKRAFGKPFFWSWSNAVASVALRMLETEDVEAVIMVESFACGTDAWVGSLLERAFAERGKPFMQLVMDEHTADAGLRTRLEAFLDMVLWRRGGLCS